MLGGSASRKRTRANDDNENSNEDHFEKRPRPTTELDGADRKRYHGHHDSVLSTPIFARNQVQYDSDEPYSVATNSPEAMSMSSDDEMNDSTFSQSPEDSHMQPRPSQWRLRLAANRVPTPIIDIRPGARPLQRSGARQHIRQRHPQENIGSSDLLEVPSPVDEDGFPTPPSAAEAAGSQLSMLTVSDMDMDDDDDGNELVPTISVETTQTANRGTTRETHSLDDSGTGLEPMDSGPDAIVVRKQRQRSGALSSGNALVSNGSSNLATAKRGFSVGFRADCEKCILRVPGHMNHFLGS